VEYLKTEKTDDNILVITIDCPDTAVNKVSSGLLDEIEKMLDQKVAEARGLVILSAKEDNFMVGADIDELKGMQTEEEVVRYIEKAHNILNRTESLPIPVVCGIHGNCLGGGLELALVTDYRIASDSTATVMGLPEVQLGLFPAAGGTQRLPRLIGLKQALPMMLTAKNVRSKKARKLGLIDEITTPFGLKTAAVQKATELARNGNRQKTRKRSLVDRLLESTPVGRNIVFKQARAMVMKQSHGLYPAPLAIIDSVKHGYDRGIEKGLKADIRRFGELVMSPQSKSLMHLFFGMTDLKKNPLKEKAVTTDKLAVLGAGLMGSGIATVSIGICETILMKDITLDAAAKGMQDISRSLNVQKRSGGITPFEKDVRYGKLVPCDNYLEFKNTNLVIEAVFEDLDLKRQVLKDVEAATGEKTIFASNTSALPIHAIARDCKRPENVIGMHYFSPVHRMPLLEIITTDRTAEWVTATAVDFGIAQGKTCIVVKDGPGFYTTRILAPLLNESVFLVEEGAKIREIDRAMLLFGYPVGPMALLDEVGIDVGAHVAGHLGKAFEARDMKTSDGLPKLFDNGYLGKKNKKGFYRYVAPKIKGMRPADEGVYSILGNAQRKAFAREEIQNRISLMMVNEAVLCLEEGIISSPGDGDVGAILGLGFPPFRGGPFRHIDSVGAGVIVKTMEDLEKKYGPRFKPTALLMDMASKGNRFFA